MIQFQRNLRRSLIPNNSPPRPIIPSRNRPHSSLQPSTRTSERCDINSNCMDSGCPPSPATIARIKTESCKTRKQQFMQAVQILASSDQFIYQVAQHVPEEKLPAFPGGAALEFVAACQKLHQSINIPVESKTHQLTALHGQLPLSHALRVKSAEYWLTLGEADEAVRELEALPKRAWNHPSAVKARVAAIGALWERPWAIARA